MERSAVKYKLNSEKNYKQLKQNFFNKVRAGKPLKNERISYRQQKKSIS